ncbi:pyruvate, phosphate dikinase, partial [bacterium]|nr:pyruvate, phosphate dikinase [bacterium]
MNSFIVPLNVSQASISEVGGKGINLSRLIRAGFPVPPGFVITTAAYHAFVDSNDLNAAIFALVDDRIQSVEEISAAIRLRFEQANIPDNLSSAIVSAYIQHFPTLANEAPVPVVARSSATAEDLLGASFAGQHESFLNVCGEQELLRAVQRCWSSLWTARALDYRSRKNIVPGSLGMAVVVQAMVPAQAAGVLFTVSPLSMSRDEMVIEAVWGLGESIVSGLTTPDHVIINRVTGAIKQIMVGDKAVMTAPVGSGTAERDVEARLRHTPVLSTSQVAELATLGEAVEAHFGTPQDIEWCAANGNFYIVQSRPITTLPPQTVHWESPIPDAKWQKDVQAAEWVIEPLSPLGATTTLAAMVSARQTMRTWPPVPKVRAPWSTLMNGWFYQRV